MVDVPVATKKARRPYRKLSEEERRVINNAVLTGMTAREVFEQGLMPGRSLNDIYNHIGIAKADLNGRCRKCSSPRAEGHVHCDDCREQLKTYRRNTIASGRCAKCRKPREDNDAGSLTLCGACVKIQRESNRKYQQRRNSAASKGRVSRAGKYDPMFARISLLKWSYTGSIRVLPDFFPSTDHKFVDVFGGSGRILVLAHALGFERLVWNDIHPLLIDFHRLVAEDRYPEVFEEAARIVMETPTEKFLQQYQRALKGAYKPVKRAALLFVFCLSNEVGSMFDPKIETLRMPPEYLLNQASKPRKAFSAATLTQGSFQEVIEEHDAHDTFFFLDPPFPGTLQFETNLSYKDTEELARVLAAVEGRFLMVCRPDRTVLKQFAPFAHTYEAKFKGRGGIVREMWMTNFELPDNDKVRPLDPSAFGLVVEKKAVMRKVLSLDAVTGSLKRVIRKHLDQGYEVVFRP